MSRPIILEVQRWGWALVALLFGVRLMLALGTDVYFDEAYYWTWGQRLDLGYFDHPPLVAWLIRIFGVRSAALLCGLGTLAAVYGFARDLGGAENGHSKGLMSATLWSLVPAGILAGVVATPDAPLLLFWTLALWALYRDKWVWAGVACGLALLSKYSAVLLGVIFAIDCIRRRRMPWGAFATLAIALLIFSPVIIWNARHGWQGFAFQLHHGLSGAGGLRSVGVYALGQLGMAGPLVFALTLLFLLRKEGDGFLRIAACVPLVFFGYAAYRTRGEANWPGMAYLAACVGFSGVSFSPKAQRWFASAAWTSAVLLVVLAAQITLMVVHFDNDIPISRLHGWPALSALQGSVAKAVFAPNYQMASEAWFHSGIPASTESAYRRSQYDLWAPPPLQSGDAALWVSEGQTPPDNLQQQFQRLEGPIHLRAFLRGVQIHDFQVWTLKGHK